MHITWAHATYAHHVGACDLCTSRGRMRPMHITWAHASYAHHVGADSGMPCMHAYLAYIAYIQTCIYTRMPCMHTHIHAYKRASACIYTHIRTYIDTHIRTYTYTHILKHTYISSYTNNIYTYMHTKNTYHTLHDWMRGCTHPRGHKLRQPFRSHWLVRFVTHIHTYTYINVHTYTYIH
jgi:hypothetical protein